MATNNAVNVGLSGVTGTGSFVGSASPVLTGTPTTPQIGFTDNTKGIVGTATNDSAGSGFVGQILKSTILYSGAISITTGTLFDLTFLDLTAGDWDVYGNIFFTFTASSVIYSFFNTTSVSFPDNAFLSTISTVGSTLNAQEGIVAYPQRYSFASTTRVYLSGRSTFSGSGTACGEMFARRRR